MMSNIERLLSLAGPPLGPSIGLGRERAGLLNADLHHLLSRTNGFYAFESALHLLPLGSTAGVMDLVRWNSSGLWRDRYDLTSSGHVFFAEDVFGVQFAIEDEKIVQFDPETGGTEVLADNLEAWAGRILDDYEVLTGYPVAHDWQRQHGPLPAGERLIPMIPFVLGGEFSVENLYALDAVQGMRLRADITRQIKHLPDGTQITFKVVD